MKNKEELITHLIDSRFLQSPKIIEAIMAIDRKDFVLEKYNDFAYEDIPLSIGFEQTISQPAVVSFMLELLDPDENDKILDIGSGSGWTTALLANIARKGHVIGVEIINDLVELGQKNLISINLKTHRYIKVIKQSVGQRPLHTTKS